MRAASAVGVPSMLPVRGLRLRPAGSAGDVAKKGCEMAKLTSRVLAEIVRPFV